MGLLKKCSNCGTSILSGRQVGEHIFCSTVCEKWLAFPGFCKQCGAETSDKSLGGTFTLNLIGTKIYHLGCKGKTCPTCSSETKRMWFVALLIPIFPVSREYRVRYVSPSRYVSRRVVQPGELSAVAPLKALPKDVCPRCGMNLAGRKECPNCAGAREMQAKTAGTGGA